MAGMKDQTDSATAGPRRSRRMLLAGAAGGLGVLTAETLVGAAPAQATQGQPVILGQDNINATARTGVIATSGESALLADPSTGIGVGGRGVGSGAGVKGQGGASSGAGVAGVGGGGGAGVAGTGGASGGTGVVGTGTDVFAGVFGIGGASNAVGVSGLGGGGNGIGVAGAGTGTGDGVLGRASTGNGVHGTATAAAGAGVLAENTAGGPALKATGPAVFSRSGLLTVAAGKSSGTVTGVALTAASLVLAILQQDKAGVWVRSAVPNIAGSSFTVHLSKAVTASVKVAWFVVN